MRTLLHFPLHPLTVVIHAHPVHVPLHALTVLIEFDPLHFKVKLSKLDLQVHSLYIQVHLLQFILAMIFMFVIMVFSIVMIVMVIVVVIVVVSMTISVMAVVMPATPVMVVVSTLTMDCHPLGFSLRLRELALGNGTLNGFHHAKLSIIMTAFFMMRLFLFTNGRHPFGLGIFLGKLAFLDRLLELGSEICPFITFVIFGRQTGNQGNESNQGQ
tara:strand:+ start:3554 stop:4195 length:642 start_codon:yes stop_codon:yes gene_type:complete